jgi:hypothetical protein
MAQQDLEIISSGIGDSSFGAQDDRDAIESLEMRRASNTGKNANFNSAARLSWATTAAGADGNATTYTNFGMVESSGCPWSTNAWDGYQHDSTCIFGVWYADGVYLWPLTAISMIERALR